MKYIRRSLAVVAATSLLFFSAPAPVAKADSAEVTIGVWAILPMILGSLLELPVGGPGYVDIVGRECEEDEGLAKWSVSSRGFGSASAPHEHMTTQRIVIPKVAGDTGIAVGEPEISNVQLRNTDYREGDERYSEIRVARAWSEYLDGLDGEERQAAEADLLERYAAARPDSLLLGEQAGALDGFGGMRWTGDYGLNTVAIGPMDEDWDEWVDNVGDNFITLLDSDGNAVHLLNARTEDSGDVTVYYQAVPPEVFNSAQQDEGDVNPRLFPGVTTNLERDVYVTTIPADQFSDSVVDYSVVLPAGEVVDVDLEGDVIEVYRQMAEGAGVPYDGSLGTDVQGALWGGMVVPLDNVELEPVKVTSEQQTPGLWMPQLPTDEGGIGTGDRNFYYEVSDSPSGDYWVIDYIAPLEQVTFDVTVQKGEEGDLEGLEAPEGAGNFLPAQVYTAQSCTRWENDLNWQCQSLLDYDWGAGGTTENTTPLVTDGVVRGTLDVPELPESLRGEGADIEREYRRGVFGNDRCMVTRPTEDPDDYDALASTILPSDYNDRFPGQQMNAVGPLNPMRGSPFLEEVPMRGSNDGLPWSSGDACDQAAVAIVCEADEEPDPSTPPGTTEPSTPGGSTPPSGTTEPSTPGGSTPPSGTTEPSTPGGGTTTPGVPGTTEPTAPGGTTTTPGGPGGTTTTPGASGTTEPTAPGGTTTPGAPGSPGSPGSPGQPTPPSGGGGGLPVTGVEIAGLAVLAGAAIAAGLGLLNWRRNRGK